MTLPIPDTWATVIRDLMARVSRLEASNSASSMSVRNGNIVVQDASGNSMVTLGKQAAGGYGIRIDNSNGRNVLTVDSNFGWGQPWLQLPMMPSTSTNSGTNLLPLFGTNSGTMTECYVVDFYASGHKITFDCWAWLGAGVTSMQYDITVEERGSYVNGGIYGTEASMIGGPQTVTPTQEVAPGGYLNGTTIPAAAISPGRTGTDPVGGSFRLRYKARVNAGAGFCTLAPIVNPLNFA